MNLKLPRGFCNYDRRHNLSGSGLAINTLRYRFDGLAIQYCAHEIHIDRHNGQKTDK